MENAALVTIDPDGEITVQSYQWYAQAVRDLVEHWLGRAEHAAGWDAAALAAERALLTPLDSARAMMHCRDRLVAIGERGEVHLHDIDITDPYA